MNSELKAYLDKLRAETRALYAEFDRQFPLRAALPAKRSAGAPPPPLTRSAVVASDGDPLIDSPVVAVVPDGYCFTAKAQEILEVAPDAPPTCTEMAPITCSTKCSTQVDAVASADEVQDGATTVHPVPTTIVDVVPVLAALDASAKPLDIDATGVVPPTPTTCSTECPSRALTASTSVLAASVVTNDFTTPSRMLQAAAPALIHELRVLRPAPWPSFQCHSRAADTTKLLSWLWYMWRMGPVQKDSCPQSEIKALVSNMSMVCGNRSSSHGYISGNNLLSPSGIWCLRDLFLSPMSCWPDSQYVQQTNAVLETPLCPERHNIRICRRGVAPSFLLADLLEEKLNGNPKYSLTITSSENGYKLPSIRTNIATAEVVSSAAITSYIIPSVAMTASIAAMAVKPAPMRCSAENLAHTSDWVQPLIATIDSVDEAHDTATIELLYPPSLEHQPWPLHVQVQIKFKGSLPRPCPWPSFDCFHEESSRCRQSVQPELQWSSFSSNCRAVQVCSELPNGELLSDYYCSVAMFCSLVPISVNDLGASEFVEPPFLIIHEQVRELASSFCLEKLWSTRDSMYKIQEQGNFCGHQVLEHAPVCSTHRPNKLQGTMQIMSISVRWSFLRLEEFQGSGCFTRDCSSEQYRDPCVLLACLMVQPIGSVHKRGVQTNAVKSKEFKRNICLCSSIKLVSLTSSILIRLEQFTDKNSCEQKPGLHPFCTRTSRALMVLMFAWPLSSERELIAGATAISTEKLLQSSSFPCGQTCYLDFGSSQACLQLNEVCAAAAVYLFKDYLSIWSELHIVVQEQVRQWAWYFYLEKSWIRYLACKSQERGKIYEHHILEYVVVSGIPIRDKLQETTQIMTMSVQSRGKIRAKEQPEDGRATRMDRAFYTADVYTRHADDTSTLEMDEVQQMDNPEEKKQAPYHVWHTRCMKLVLEQPWDPGGRNLSVGITHSSDETDRCRGISVVVSKQGGSLVASAWGQAESQGVGDVSDPISTSGSPSNKPISSWAGPD